MPRILGYGGARARHSRLGVLGVRHIRSDDRADDRPTPAPVDVALHPVRLPADVLEVLDAEALEPDRHLAAAPRARTGVRGHGLALLVERERGGHRRRW